MGQFNINLSGNRNGNVAWGKTIKTVSLINLLPWLKGNVEEKIGYIIKVESAAGQESTFHLFKSKDGNWSQDEDGKILLEGETMLEIKEAIEEHEKNIPT